MSFKRPRRDSSEQSVPESTTEEEKVQRPTRPPHYRTQLQTGLPVASQPPPPQPVTLPHHSVEEDEEEGPTPRRTPAQLTRSKKATSIPLATPPRNSIIIRGINAAKDVNVKNRFEQRLPDPVKTHSAVQGTSKETTSVLIEGVTTGGAVYAGSFLNDMTGGKAAKRSTADRESSASKRKRIYNLERPGNFLIIKNAFTVNKGSIKAKRYREYERHGTQKDFNDMKTLFENDLGCIPNEDENVTKDGLTDTLTDFKQACIDADSSFLVVIIITHGGPGDLLLMHDLKTVSLFEDVVSPFNEYAFPEFEGRPKIFLIQTCTNFTDPEDAAAEVISPPGDELADIFVGGASLPYGFAWRRPFDGDGPDNEEGGWYLQSIKDVFSSRWRDENLKTMHDRVEDIVEQRAETENQGRPEGDQHIFQRPYRFCSDFGIFKFPPPTDD